MLTQNDFPLKQVWIETHKFISGPIIFSESTCKDLEELKAKIKTDFYQRDVDFDVKFKDKNNKEYSLKEIKTLI